VVFGGYGRKTKHRGDVYYVCLDCQALTVFGLVENYGYGQLYGVRIAKVGSNRYMLCAQCHSGYELTKEACRTAAALRRDKPLRTLDLRCLDRNANTHSPRVDSLAGNADTADNAG